LQQLPLGCIQTPQHPSGIHEFTRPLLRPTMFGLRPFGFPPFGIPTLAPSPNKQKPQP